MPKERMPAEQKRSIITATTLRPGERVQLEQHAAARGVTVSSVLRKMILRDLRRSGRTVEAVGQEA